MFFKRKPRNRRHTRDHVLDVKLSASQRRENRTRRLTLFLGSSLLLFLTLFGLWRGGEALLLHKVYGNPYFAIDQLEVETDGVLAPEQIRSWAGVRPKDNLMALDLARVKRDLELVPAIEGVVVERVLPRTLRIRVTEREPIAQVAFPHPKPGGASESGLYTLDANGFFMFPVVAGQRATPAAQTNDYLPLITGIPLADLRPGRQAESPQVRAALELIRVFERSSMVGAVDLSSIEVAQANVLVVRTGQGNEVTFSLRDFEGQLRRWRLVHDEAQRRGKLITSLDLAVGNNAPLLWADLGGTPPPPPKPAKPSPYKKKHV